MFVRYGKRVRAHAVFIGEKFAHALRAERVGGRHVNVVLHELGKTVFVPGQVRDFPFRKHLKFAVFVDGIILSLFVDGLQIETADGNDFFDGISQSLRADFAKRVF